MKVGISSTSGFCSKYEIIETNSIEEAIERLRTDKELIKSVIDLDYTWINYDQIPNCFIVSIPQNERTDYEIEIYDYYRE